RDLAIPHVVRLLGYARPRPQRVRLSRKNIFARDKNTCQYCGKAFKSAELNLDHVLPKSRGGQMRWDNIVCSCVACNTRKSNRTPREAGMKLIRKPVKPRRVTELIHIRHDSWKHFVEDAYWNVELQD
ncbi:MAG: HNH endonuclease, partial [Planctomycetota bacterium]